MSKNKTVVITGIGMMTPLGLGADVFWENIAAGNSGIAPVSLPEHQSIAPPDSIGGEVSEFTEKDARKAQLKPLRKSVKVMCREIQLGAASALQAVEHAGLDMGAIDHTRLGISFGANLMSSPPEVLKDAARNCTVIKDGRKVFSEDMWGEHGFAGMQPLWLLRYLPNMPACHIGIAIDARGPNNSLTLDEASGGMAVSEAASIIQRGRADIMVAGTTGTRIHPVKAAHSALWDTLAAEPSDPKERCRPFDLNRQGEVVAEGSCSLILEDEAHAVARGATIYGRVLATAGTCVLDRSGVADPKAAMVNAMRAGLERAGLAAADVGHLNAHGAGSRALDQIEAAAVHEALGAAAAEIPVTAIKSYVGNAGSGCGLIELSASLLGWQHDVVPATRNYVDPDPECNLNVIAGGAAAATNKTLLKINVTRMGQASAIVVSA